MLGVDWHDQDCHLFEHLFEVGAEWGDWLCLEGERFPDALSAGLSAFVLQAAPNMVSVAAKKGTTLAHDL